MTKQLKRKIKQYTKSVGVEKASTLNRTKIVDFCNFCVFHNIKF